MSKTETSETKRSLEFASGECQTKGRVNYENGQLKSISVNNPTTVRELGRFIIHTGVSWCTKDEFLAFAQMVAEMVEEVEPTQVSGGIVQGPYR